jgi:hypothetical protein
VAGPGVVLGTIWVWHLLARPAWDETPVIMYGLPVFFVAGLSSAAGAVVSDPPMARRLFAFATMALLAFGSIFLFSAGLLFFGAAFFTGLAWVMVGARADR